MQTRREELGVLAAGLQRFDVADLEMLGPAEYHYEYLLVVARRRTGYRS